MDGYLRMDGNGDGNRNGDRVFIHLKWGNGWKIQSREMDGMEMGKFWNGEISTNHKSLEMLGSKKNVLKISWKCGQQQKMVCFLSTPTNVEV